MRRDTLVLLTNHIHCFHGGVSALTLFDVWRYEASLKMVYGSVQCLGGVMFKHTRPCKCISVFLLLESVIY